MDDRRALSAAVGSVVWNASNHPNPTAVLGRDISTLKDKIVEAVVAAGFTRPDVTTDLEVAKSAARREVLDWLDEWLDGEEIERAIAHFGLGGTS